MAKKMVHLKVKKAILVEIGTLYLRKSQLCHKFAWGGASLSDLQVYEDILRKLSGLVKPYLD